LANKINKTLVVVHFMLLMLHFMLGANSSRTSSTEFQQLLNLS